MRIAVITGSASGIGAATRKRLEGQGFTVIGVDLKDAEVIGDLSTPAGRQKAISDVSERANGQIDRLVLSAGVGGHLADGKLVAKVNYYGTVEVLDGLKDTLSGRDARVVVVGSNSSQMHIDPNAPIVQALLESSEDEALSVIGDTHGAIVYGQTKHALTRAIRHRVRDLTASNIRINVIAPGTTETPLFRGSADHPVIKQAVEALDIPQNRYAEADEIAEIIEFMLSDAARYMTGSVVFVDGGTDAVMRPDNF